LIYKEGTRIIKFACDVGFSFYLHNDILLLWLEK